LDDFTEVLLTPVVVPN